jgi:hypothetical protein
MLKKILSVFLVLLLPSVAVAGNLVEQLNICAQTKDSLVRLVCYDKLAKNSLSTGVIELKPVSVQPLASKEEKASQLVTQEIKNDEDSFGQQHLKKDSNNNAIKQVIFIVVNVKKDVRDKLRLIFENGQVWKQTDGNRLNIKSKDRVEISKGMLGAFYLRKVNQNKSIKVKRIK